MYGYLRKISFLAFAIVSFVLLFTSGASAQSAKVRGQKIDPQIKLKKEATTGSDPWTVKNVITVKELSRELSHKKNKPLLLHVGFSFLYQQSHIPGSKYVGPARSRTGINSIKQAVKHYKKNKNIVVYCGCCPWTDCPNVRPAYAALKKMGYKNVKVLYIPDSFMKDWTKEGYTAVK